MQLVNQLDQPEDIQRPLQHLLTFLEVLHLQALVLQVLLGVAYDLLVPELDLVVVIVVPSEEILPNLFGFPLALI